MKLPRRLYRYRPLDDSLLQRELSALEDSYLFSPSFSAMNDPMEAFYKTGGPQDLPVETLFSRAGMDVDYLYTHLGEMIGRFALVSFASSYKDLPMWAYYGSNFAGMCLEFDTEELAIGDFQGESLRKVTYAQDALPPITTLDLLSGIEEPISLRLTRKRIEWEHEKEWRYITGSVGPKYYLDDAIRRVFLGPRVKPEHAERVCEVFKYRPTEVFQGEIRDFGLHFHSIKPAHPLHDCVRVGNGKFDPTEHLYPDDELKEFLGDHFEDLLHECQKIALRPNMEDFGGIGLSASDKSSIYIWTRYKLRDGRDIYQKRYYSENFRLVPELSEAE